MTIEQIKEKIPDFGRDIRLNLDTVLTPEGAPGLEKAQLAGVALACAHATGSKELAEAVASTFSEVVTPEVAEAAKAAATIMAMNNVYYRSIHLAEDAELSRLPARLRMNVIGKPGIPKADFELMSLAVSAINGCGMCIVAHVAEIRKAGVSNEGIQSAIRIGAVLNAVRQALSI
jgi:alkyl hydroperoxide reductase subunit D